MIFDWSWMDGYLTALGHAARFQPAPEWLAVLAGASAAIAAFLSWKTSVRSHRFQRETQMKADRREALITAFQAMNVINDTSIEFTTRIRPMKRRHSRLNSPTVSNIHELTKGIQGTLNEVGPKADAHLQDLVARKKDNDHDWSTAVVESYGWLMAAQHNRDQFTKQLDEMNNEIEEARQNEIESPASQS